MTDASLRSAEPAVQQQRRLRFAAVLAGARFRLAVVPEQAVRNRQRVQVCGAARLLTALGVRVRVVQPERPWPRHRPLALATPDLGWLADLAVLTAVPRATPGWAALADRLFGLPTRPAPVDAGALVCPVAVRFLSDDGELAVVPATAAGVATVRGLLVEVTLLAAEEQASPQPAETMAA